MAAISSELLFLVALLFFTCRTRMGVCEDEEPELEKNDDDLIETPYTLIPKFTTYGGYIAVLEGDSIKLRCEVDKLGEFGMMWRSGLDLLSLNKIRLTKNPNIDLDKMDYSLELKNIDHGLEGVYNCTVSTSVPMVQSTGVRLLRSSGHHRHHHHHRQLEDVSWEVGNNIKMQCLVKQSAHIKWYHQDEEVTLGYHFQILSDDRNNRALLVKNLQPKVFGNYKCLVEAKNQPVMEAQFEINVKPEITLLRERMHADEGISLNFICRFEGHPIPKVHWLFNNEVIISKERFFIASNEKQSKLHIRNLKLRDFGNYTCVAANKVGSANKTEEVNAIVDELGIAGIVNIRSDAYGDHANHYELSFDVESFLPVIEYSLKIKEGKGSANTDQEDWKEVIIPANHTGGSLHIQSFDITGLRPNSEYDVFMRARTAKGWNDDSGVFRFYTKKEGIINPPRHETTENTIMETTNSPFVEEYSSQITTNSPEVSETEGEDNGANCQIPTNAMVAVLLTILFSYFT